MTEALHRPDELMAIGSTSCLRGLIGDKAAQMVRLCRDHEPRRAGLIVMDLVPNLRYQGTAYVAGDAVTLELARSGGDFVRSYPDMAGLRRDGVLSSSTIGRLQELLPELARAAHGADSEAGPEADSKAGAELELLIDTAERLLILQRRILPDGTGIFHTPGTYQGPLMDLRFACCDDPRDVDRTLADCAGKAAIVWLLDRRRLDGFTLAWRQRATGVPAPSALVLAAGPGSRAGMPTHIPWMLREALPRTLLITLGEPEISLIASGTRCTLSSDGVRVTFRPQ